MSSKYFPPTGDDLAGSNSSSPKPKASEPGQGHGQTETTSESLAASLPDAPTTEPKSLDEPKAKKQKVEAASAEDVIDNKEAEMEDADGAEDNLAAAGSTSTLDRRSRLMPVDSDPIEEGWVAVDRQEIPIEDVLKSDDGEEEPPQGEDDGDVPSRAEEVPNMLTKDW
jgi:hypothetical protein